MIAFWLLFLLIFHSNAQTFCVSNSAVCLYSEERNNSVAFRIHVFTPNTIGWFGFGFGSNMDSAEIFVRI
jgi:hypothetical protein